MILSSERLVGESEIVWIEDPEHHPYVRTEFRPTSTRDEAPGLKTGGSGMRMVGYAVLSQDAERGFGRLFSRRIFWVDEDDRVNEPNGRYSVSPPRGAVDPLTINPGKLGCETDRCRGEARRMRFPTPDDAQK